MGLIGSGQAPTRGDVSRALHGVRCLDELPECRRHVPEVLHQLPENSLTE
jgi:predicted ATPase with chaperone activity